MCRFWVSQITHSWALLTPHERYTPAPTARVSMPSSPARCQQEMVINDKVLVARLEVLGAALQEVWHALAPTTAQLTKVRALAGAVLPLPWRCRHRARTCARTFLLPRPRRRCRAPGPSCRRPRLDCTREHSAGRPRVRAPPSTARLDGPLGETHASCREAVYLALLPWLRSARTTRVLASKARLGRRERAPRV
jgi:hypothetical protein